METKTTFLDIDQKKYDFKEDLEYLEVLPKGLSREVVEKISKIKNEPEWMLKIRLKAFETFMNMPMPTWGADLSKIDFNDITYFIAPTKKVADRWEDVPEKIRKTFEKLGIPESERKFLAGAGAMMESTTAYHKLREDIEKKGVIFCDTDTALQKYPDLVKKYFGTVVPIADNKFAALNTAVWSGGSFIYVPKGVKIGMPLQAYFRINAQNVGQFERTLIIVDEGAEVNYVEGCSSPSYSSDSLHTAIVEVIALKDARVRYTTLQNWSDNIYNLVTKRAYAYENAYVEWLDANLGCLAEGTLISTNPGINNIEKINEGEKVITFNEQTKELEARKVIAKKFSGIKPTYSITLDKGKREIIATNSHPFLSLKYLPNRAKKLGRYEFVWTSLSQLSNGAYLLVTKEMPDLGKPYTLSHPNTERSILNRNQYGAEYIMSTNYKYTKLDLPKETNNDLLWLFGLTIGDGNIDIAKSKKSDNNRYGRLGFSITDIDPAREKVVKLMKKIFNLDKYTERKDKIIITYNSLLLAEFFKLNGIDGNAHTKRVPKWVYTLPLNQKRALLAGYIEADGRINGNNARFKACNKELLEDLKILAMTCGIEVNRIKEQKEIKSIKVNGINTPEKEYTSYIMHISDLFKLREFLCEGNKIKVPENPRSKKGRFLDKTKRRIPLPGHLELLQITSIKPNGELPTYDLEIEGTHNFIANGIIVHNSAITMKYPSVYLKGQHAKANILSVAFANNNQNQDAGAKALHFAPNTSSTIISKSISKGSGKTTFRGLVQIMKGAKGSKAHMRCDALMLDKESRSETIPTLKINEEDVQVGHEATVGKVGEDQLFYLMSRGLTEQEAVSLIVSGFFKQFTKELPLEYAVEFNKLIELEMKDAIG